MPRSFSSVAALVENPGLGAATRREPEAVVEHRAQLRCRVHVEGLPGVPVDLRLEARALSGELRCGAPELVGVDRDARHLHPREHTRQRPFDLVVEPLHAVCGETGAQHGREERDRDSPRPSFCVDFTVVGLRIVDVQLQLAGRRCRP